MTRFLLRRRPSAALVVAFAALMVALGGTAVAARVLITTSAQVAPGAITSSDVRDGTLTPADLSSAARAAAAGRPGPQGERGAPGTPGPQGAPGTPGTVGGQGPAGPAGEDGAPGRPGERGSDGARGPAGAPGEDGKAGAAGPAGPAGARGPAGPAGPTGPGGAQGERGPAGPQGERGPSEVFSAHRGGGAQDTPDVMGDVLGRSDVPAGQYLVSFKGAVWNRTAHTISFECRLMVDGAEVDAINAYLAPLGQHAQWETLVLQRAVTAHGSPTAVRVQCRDAQGAVTWLRDLDLSILRVGQAHL
jgi:hypothetical protein